MIYLYTLSLFVNIVVSVVLTLYNFRKRNPSCLLYALFFFFFGFAEAIHSLTFGVDESNCHLNVVFNFIIMITIGFIFLGETALGYFLAKHKKIDRFFPSFLRRRSPNFLLHVSYCIFFINLIGFFLILKAYNMSFSDILATGRMNLRLIEFDYKLKFFQMLFPAFSLVIYACLVNFRKNHFVKIILLTAIIICISKAFLFGGRAFLLITISPFIWLFITKAKRRFFKLIFIILILCPTILFVVLGVFHLHRWQSDRNLNSFGQLLWDRKSFDFILNNRSDFFIRNKLISAIEIFPTEHDWLYGNTYRTMLLFWLPSSLSFGLKLDTIYIFYEAKNGNKSNLLKGRFSDHPTLPGDLYINFGYVFFLAAFVWGFLLAVVNYIARRYEDNYFGFLLGGFWCYFIMLAFRGSIYQPFFSVLFSLLFVYAIGYFVAFLRISVRSQRQNTPKLLESS